jgi:hypothetical protein
LMWPQGGEIDIMEFVASIPYANLGSVHYAKAWLKTLGMQIIIGTRALITAIAISRYPNQLPNGYM